MTANSITLVKTIAYRVHYWEGENHGQDVTSGYYSSSIKADDKAKGSGYWGGNANVDMVDDVYTDGVFLYKVKQLGRYTDKEEERVETLTKSISNKLTPEELEYIKNNKI